MTGPPGTLAEFQAGRANARQLESYAREVLLGVVRQGRYEMGQPQRTTINGLPAVVLPARAWSSGRPVELTVVAYALGGEEAYHFITMAPQGQAAVFDPMYDSFRRLSEREREGGGGRRLAVVTVKSGDTVESLAALMAPDVDNLDRFRMLNALQPGQPLRPGSRVKVVVEGRR
jgi:predicted Zn-dependent protease